MTILRLLNTAGNVLPHKGRRFVLDRLGLGKFLAHMAAKRVESIILQNGMTFYFNPLMHWNVAKPENHEPEVINALHRYLKPGHVFYDVGANIGLYSLIAASIVGPSGQVLAFEPGKINLHYFERSIEQNGVSNIDLRSTAIGAKDGTMAFEPRGAMSGRLIHEGEETPNSIAIAVRSIDSLIAKGEPIPDVIKIDIEGGEGDALSGASETLKRGPVVICEMHKWAAEGVSRAEDALRKAKYQLSIVGGASATTHHETYHVVAIKN